MQQFEEAALIKKALKENSASLFLSMYDGEHELPSQEERALEAAIYRWICLNPVAWHIAVDEYKDAFKK